MTTAKRQRYDELIAEGKSSSSALMITDQEFGEGNEEKEIPKQSEKQSGTIDEVADRIYVKTKGISKKLLDRLKPSELEIRRSKELKEAQEEGIHRSKVHALKYIRPKPKSEIRGHEPSLKNLGRGDMKAPKYEIRKAPNVQRYETRIQNPVGNFGSLFVSPPRTTVREKRLKGINPEYNPFGLNFGGLASPVSSPSVRKKKKISNDPLGLRGFY